MRNIFPKPIWLLLTLFLLLLASHLLLLIEPTSRTWLQSRLVGLNEEQDLIFKSLLGGNYIVSPDALYYSKPPYYYTHVDAIYFWRRARDAARFRACANKSDLCAPGVAYIVRHESDEYFKYLYRDSVENPRSPHRLRCGAEIKIVTDKEMGNIDYKAFSFSTRSGFYIARGIDNDSISLWLEDCKDDRPKIFVTSDEATKRL